MKRHWCIGRLTSRFIIFKNPREATLLEQLEGLEPRSHLGRLLETLDIQLINARSPQAKGRVERLFQTLQGRLVKELRRAEANECLRAYLPRFNRRFIKPPTEEPRSAYRPPFSRAEANDRICFTYWRTVAQDQTISLFGHTRAALRHRLDGRMAVFFRGEKPFMLQPAQLGPPKLEQFEPHPSELAGLMVDNAINQPLAPPAAPVKPNRHKPAADHPWRKAQRAAFERKQRRLQREQEEPE